jgi:uncharacterized protein (DUF4415 family)
MARKPDPYLIDDDNPELTDEQLRNLRPASEVLPPDLYARLAARKPGQRGPQKAATKIAVTLRLDPEVVAAFKADGPGWQTRINQALKKVVARKAKAA